MRSLDGVSPVTVSDDEVDREALSDGDWPVGVTRGERDCAIDDDCEGVVEFGVRLMDRLSDVLRDGGGIFERLKVNDSLTVADTCIDPIVKVISSDSDADGTNEGEFSVPERVNVGLRDRVRRLLRDWVFPESLTVLDGDGVSRKVRVMVVSLLSEAENVSLCVTVTCWVMVSRDTVFSSDALNVTDVDPVRLSSCVVDTDSESV